MSKKPNKKPPKQLMIGTKAERDIQTNQETIKTKNEQAKQIKKIKSFNRYNTPKEKELFKRLTIIVGILAVGVFITLYFISPFSKVGKIVVTGVQKSDGAAIVASSELKINKGLWEQYFKRDESSKSIVKENPRVESANVQLTKVNTMQINVKEYKIIGYVERDDKTYEVLSNGKFVEMSTSDKQPNLPLLINFTEGENLKEFIKKYDQIPVAIKEKIATIESLATETNPYRIQLNMKDGNEVIGLSTTIADKMTFYDKIVAEMDKTGVIDMEAGTSGVFSYPKENEKTNETEESATEESATSE